MSLTVRITKRLAVIILPLFCLLISFLLLADFRRETTIVAVLDTGVSADHPLLDGKVINGFDFASWDFDSSDMNGHGTHVGGIIAQEAPDAKILSVRVITQQDEVKNTSLAIMYAIFKGADVINMSFIEPKHFFTKWAIAYGKMKGVVFVASSGNQGRSQVSYPSKYEGVYSVAAFDPQKEKVVGNVSDKVRFVAPGINIPSASLDGGIVKKSGTSMSAAFMSSAIANIIQEYPDLYEQQLDRLLESNSVEIVTTEQKLGESHVFHMIDSQRLKYRSGQSNADETMALAKTM